MTGSDDMPFLLPLERVVRPRDDLVVQDVDRDTVILDLRSDAYFGLNPIGRRVWHRLERAHDLRELVVDIAETFGIDFAQAHADVSAFIQQAEQADLLISD